MTTAERCRSIAESDSFERLVILIILLNGVAFGFDAVPDLPEDLYEWIGIFLWASQLFFVGEIAIRMLAYAPRYKEFFGEWWNTFDFVIVAGSLLPGVGSFSTVARLLRVLRVFRLLTASDHLRPLVDDLAASLGLQCRVTLVGATIAYVFAISGYYLFAEQDPAHWEGLAECMRTVFLLLLLQEVRPVVDGGGAGIYLYLVALYWITGTLLLNAAAMVFHLHGGPRGESSGTGEE